MSTDLLELERMFKQLSLEQQHEIVKEEVPPQRLGRKKSHKEKYQHIAFTAPPALEHTLLVLMERERCNLSQLIRGLIKLGLEEHANGRAIDTRS